MAFLGKVKDIINLIRVRQWYKNLVVFLAIIFSGHLIYYQDLYSTFLAFISLSLISSSYYIINDLVDLKKDQVHPEKRLRPLAAKRISKLVAILLIILLLAGGLILAYGIRYNFFLAAIALFILSQIYTFFLKKIIFADVLAISSLFVIRALAGAYVINVVVSPWLVLCPFFLALFLAIGKRHSDLLLLKKEAQETRAVLKTYNLGLTNSLMLMATTLLIISYALYSFLSPYNNLIYTLPFALFVIFRYYYLATNGSKVARESHKALKDKSIVAGIFIWLVLVIGMIYL